MSNFPVSSIGELFSLGKRTVDPGCTPKGVFLHHSLPSFDETGGPREDAGSDIDSHKFVLDHPCILVSKLNPRISRVELVASVRPDGTEIASTEYMVLAAKENCGQSVHLPFYAKLFAGAAFRARLTAVATGTTGSHTRVRPSEILSWPVVVPGLAEQRRVASVLDCVSEVERGIETSITKLCSVRRGILLSSTESVAGAEPLAGWARVPLKDVVPSAEYGISEALDRDARGLPVLRMNNIQGSRVDAGDIRYCPVSVPGRLLLRRGDVLFNRTNSMDHIGKTAMWRDELPSATFASYLVRLVPDLRRVTPEYLVEWLMHPLIRQRVRSISTVAVQQVNVNPSRLRELEIDLPVDLTEQRRILAVLESCDEQIGREIEELAKLRDLKNGLMNDLLSGRGTASALAA
ncbi:restriction endonuclease subunit S [Streptomyces sp. NPDC002855]|uniref:restriction endonuclease subunit S n=1 Tax=Streptomyces sp. NPDC002855 TaxID=3154437 RepID=UPI00332E6A41